MNDDKISELIQIVQKFCEERDWDQFHNPKDLAIGISTEGNELLDIFRFKSYEDMEWILSDPKKREMVIDELADVLFFVLRFVQMNQIDLGEGLRNKIQKNEKKYPIDRSKGKNNRYKDL